MFHQEFPELLAAFPAGQRSIVVGDINFHFDKQTDNDVRRLVDLLTEHCMTQLVTDATHRRGHTLDWLMVTDETKPFITDISVNENLFSDHKTVFFHLAADRPPRAKQTVVSRNFKKVDPEAFTSDLGSAAAELGRQLEDCSVDQLVEMYDSTLSNLLNQHAPLVSKQVTVRPSAPWISEEAREARRDRRKAEKLWRATRLEVHRQMYVCARNKAKCLFKEAKRDYVSSQLADCTSSRQLFSLTNRLLGKEKDNSLPNNIPASDIPDAFSHYFNEKIEIIRKDLDREAAQPAFEEFSGSPLVSFRPVDEKEIKELLKSSLNKSCSLDPLPTSLIKAHGDCLVPIITCIINLSLSTGVVPDRFKQALVTPLLKKAGMDQNVLKNYRPVSNLPFISKILEKVVLSRLVEHLAVNGLEDLHQSAYRANHSTETALLDVTGALLESADDGKVSVLALLDLSAAFDTLDHDILLKRLELSLGVTDTALQWFSSYLYNRKQTVVANSHRSQPTTLQFGVPQGSVLGPVLFSLYTRPLSKVMEEHGCVFHKFADDTQIQNSSSPDNFHVLKSDLEACIDDVRVWMKANKLKLNDDKTEAMLVGTKLKTASVTDKHITVGEHAVNFSEAAKNLGVYLDQTMSMKKQVSNLCRCAYLEIRRIGTIRPFLTDKAATQLVCSRVLSRLDYCNSLLAGVTSEQIGRVQRVQNSAAKLVLRKKRRDHASPLLAKLHWLPIKQRIEYKLATLAFRYFDQTLPPYLASKLSAHLPPRALRSDTGRLLAVPKARLKTAGERAFKFQATRAWNSLPLELRHSPKLSTFKSKLKTHLFSRAFADMLVS
jgi:hypothetical protein